MQNKELILSTPEYYNVYISGVGVYPLYIQTLGLFLGDLLQLWEKTAWKQGDEYFYYTIGSPLSGSNSSSSWCPKDGFKNKQLSSISILLKPAYLLVNKKTIDDSSNAISTDLPKRISSKLSIYNLIDKLNENRVHS